MSDQQTRDQQASGAGTDPHILVERDGAVGWLIFNRPNHGNALDGQMLDELETAWLTLDADPEVRVIVNTGNGPAFCTGPSRTRACRL